MCLLTDRVDGTGPRRRAGPAHRREHRRRLRQLDCAAARARGIVVTNTPDVLTEATADFTWGLILTVTRRIAEGERLLRRGEWRGWALDFMLGTDLRGKTLGIVGMGRIGRAVAARAGAFGMRVFYATLGPDPGCQAAGRAVRARQLRRTADDRRRDHAARAAHARDEAPVRSPCDPADETQAYLVNTSRGPVIDEEALAWALQERLLAGAALDVYEREPLVHPDSWASRTSCSRRTSAARRSRPAPPWRISPRGTSSPCSAARRR